MTLGLELFCLQSSKFFCVCVRARRENYLHNKMIRLYGNTFVNQLYLIATGSPARPFQMWTGVNS